MSDFNAVFQEFQVTKLAIVYKEAKDVSNLGLKVCAIRLHVITHIYLNLCVLLNILAFIFKSG